MPKWTICKAEGQGKSFGSDKIGVATENCVFPFKHDGKKYYGCAPGKDGKGPWCATKVNSKQEMEKNKWARCNSICPTSKGTSLASCVLYYGIRYCFYFKIIYQDTSI